MNDMLRVSTNTDGHFESSFMFTFGDAIPITNGWRKWDNLDDRFPSDGGEGQSFKIEIDKKWATVRDITSLTISLLTILIM